MGDGPLVVNCGRVARDRSGRLRNGTRHAEWCKAAVRSTRAAALPQPLAQQLARSGVAALRIPGEIGQGAVRKWLPQPLDDAREEIQSHEADCVIESVAEHGRPQVL